MNCWTKATVRFCVLSLESKYWTYTIYWFHEPCVYIYQSKSKCLNWVSCVNKNQPFIDNYQSWHFFETSNAYSSVILVTECTWTNNNAARVYIICGNPFDRSIRERDWQSIVGWWIRAFSVISIFDQGLYGAALKHDLTHWGRYKMAAIFQTTFSNGFSWMEIYEFLFTFHWSLFVGVL